MKVLRLRTCAIASIVVAGTFVFMSSWIYAGRKTVWPKEKNNSSSFQKQPAKQYDRHRIIQKLISVPPTLDDPMQNRTKLKTNLLHNTTQLWLSTALGQKTFLEEKNKSLSFQKQPAKQLLWPEEYDGDRIVQQLNFVPPTSDDPTRNGTKLKTILLHNTTLLWLSTALGQRTFLEEKCPVNSCFITTNKQDAQIADAIIFSDGIGKMPRGPRPTNQIWILYLLESPYLTQSFTKYSKVFNWTATYRLDSDITIPYHKFHLHDESVTAMPLERNFAANKTKKVAWFISNCGASNKRMLSALQLGQFIQVDVFGKCLGSNTCPRSKEEECLKMLKDDYKFYLAFENSNCKDYITEKLFLNGLSADVVPIVLGARKQEYERVAPYHSFIYAQDFKSPKDLADYLLMVDANDTLYNEYFQWKGTGEITIDNFQKFWCRLCAMLHADIPTKTYDDMDAWWRGPEMCAEGQQRVDDRKIIANFSGHNDSLQWRWSWW